MWLLGIVGADSLYIRKSPRHDVKRHIPLMINNRLIMHLALAPRIGHSTKLTAIKKRLTVCQNRTATIHLRINPRSKYINQNGKRETTAAEERRRTETVGDR